MCQGASKIEKLTGIFAPRRITGWVGEHPKEAALAAAIAATALTMGAAAPAVGAAAGVGALGAEAGAVGAGTAAGLSTVGAGLGAAGAETALATAGTGVLGAAEGGTALGSLVGGNSAAGLMSAALATPAEASATATGLMGAAPLTPAITPGLAAQTPGMFGASSPFGANSNVTLGWMDKLRAGATDANKVYKSVNAGMKVAQAGQPPQQQPIASRAPAPYSGAPAGQGVQGVQNLYANNQFAPPMTEEQRRRLLMQQQFGAQ